MEQSEGLPELPEYLFHKARHKIVPMEVGDLFAKAEAPESMRIHARVLVKEGWTFFVVKQTRGRCYANKKIITIPLWVLSYKPTKIRWYISHEMAHAFDKCKNNHGPEFMTWLLKICPLGDQHWEYGYKPRNAASAGVCQVGEL